MIFLVFIGLIYVKMKLLICGHLQNKLIVTQNIDRNKNALRDKIRKTISRT